MMYRQLLAAVLTICLGAAAGCDRNGDDEDETGDEQIEQGVEPTDEYDVPFPRNDWACTDENAARVKEWVESRSPENRGHHAFDRDDPDVPQVEGPSLYRAPSFVINATEDQLDIDGNPVALDGLDAPAEHLIDQLRWELSEIWEGVEQSAELLDEELGYPLVGIAVDEQVPGEYVNKLLDVLFRASSGSLPEATFVFLFEGTWPDHVEPIPGELKRHYEQLVERQQEQLEELDARERLQFDASDTELGEQWQSAGENCEDEIAERTEGLPGATPEQRQQLWLDAHVEGWLACDCSADIEFLSVHLGGLGNDVSYTTGIRPGPEGFEYAVAADELEEIEDDVPWGQQVPEQVDQSVETLELDPERD